MIRVYTSAAGNYLGKVAALLSSVRRLHPELALHLVLADRSLPAGADLCGAEVILPEQLGATPSWLFRHELVELATALKGAALVSLLERPDTEAVIYLDPDIVLFSRLDDVLEDLATAALVVTPHLVDPEDPADGTVHNEMCALQHGAFNLGFLGVRRCAEGLRFAAWWAERLRSHCEDRREAGLFTDQKWMDLAPGFFPGLRILRDVRLNVAPWNFNRRHVAGSFDQGFTVDGRPLGFYHFTGFDGGAHHEMISRYVANNGALKMLVDWYARRQAALAPPGPLTWGFGSYDDGTPISAAARAVHREQRTWLEEAFPDPFASGPGTFQSWWEWQHPREPTKVPPAGDAVGPPRSEPQPAPARVRVPTAGSQPVVLHLTHSWGGGIERWVRLFAAHDDRRNLVLSSRGGGDAYGIEHALHDASDGAELGRWVLGEPIAEVAGDHSEHRELLRSIVAEHGVEHTYVSSFIGHSLEALRPGTAVTVVYHDFFPFCPALKIYFGSTCTTCRSGHLQACLSHNRYSHLFRHQPASAWVSLRSRYFELAADPTVRHVCPSRFVIQALRTVDPRFRRLPLELIEHGIEGPAPSCFGGAPESRRLRLLVLGALNSFKGATSLGHLLPMLCGSLDVALVGGGGDASAFVGLPGLVIVEQFRIGDLDSLLGELRPDLALFASEVPETFCFTVEEVKARGIPSCVRNLGAFPERVEHDVTGLIFDTDGGCLDLVRALDRDRARLRRIAAELERRPVRTAAQMVADYGSPPAARAVGEPRRRLRLLG